MPLSHYWYHVIIIVSLCYRFHGTVTLSSGARIAGAAELAVRSVNADTALLHGHVLEYS